MTLCCGYFTLCLGYATSCTAFHLYTQSIRFFSKFLIKILYPVFRTFRPVPFCLFFASLLSAFAYSSNSANCLLYFTASATLLTLLTILSASTNSANCFLLCKSLLTPLLLFLLNLLCLLLTLFLLYKHFYFAN